ncbi:MAG: DNA-binding protein [Romboutsia sp.]|uniref:DNA-binding protein n=1 Tax=Romboutsia sp. TaxID=1965302 RepID=UPI003F38D6A4
MKGNERIERFLELQMKNIEFEKIAKEIGITAKTLRTFLNRNGYKLEDGKYKSQNITDADQIAFTEIKKEDKKNKKTEVKTKGKTKIEEAKKEEVKKEKRKKKTTVKDEKEIEVKIKKNNQKPKKDKKINITIEDMDKLCEVYDWYLQVKDSKSLKFKNLTSKKDINIDNIEMKKFKNTSIKVEKTTWEEFERLCSNSQFSKQEILTQALKDFMKEYKNLL